MLGCDTRWWNCFADGMGKKCLFVDLSELLLASLCGWVITK